MVARSASLRERSRGDAARLPWWQRRSIRRRAWMAAVYATLGFGLVLAMLPFFWMLSTSLKSTGDAFTYPIAWIPTEPRWDNYAKALLSGDFLRALRTTLVIVLPMVVGEGLSCSLVGYGFARIPFPGRRVLFMLVISTMMLPQQVTMIPTFIIYRQLGWLDTFLPFWIPAFLAAGSFFVFLMRQFFMSIPAELDDAARVDGCSTLGIFWRIMLPLAKPAVSAVGLFSFIANWNDYFRPLIYLTSPENRTLMLLLASFQQAFRVEWGQLMAATTVILMGPLLVFFFAQRIFIQGIVFTGIKG